MISSAASRHQDRQGAAGGPRRPLRQPHGINARPSVSAHFEAGHSSLQTNDDSRVGSANASAMFRLPRRCRSPGPLGDSLPVGSRKPAIRSEPRQPTDVSSSSTSGSERAAPDLADACLARAAISASLQPASRRMSAVSAPSSGGARSGATSRFHVHRLAQRRVTGVSLAKFVAKNPTSCRCGSCNRSFGRRTGWEGMSSRSKVASHSAVVRSTMATASMS